MPPGRGRGARSSPTATAASVAFRALRTQASAPLDHVSSCYRAPPVYSVHHARAAPHETTYGARAHRPLSPSRAGSARPIGRASPDTARDACDTAPPEARGISGVVARPEPTPWAETSGNRARHARGETRTPYRPPPDSCRPCPGDYTIAVSPRPYAYPVW